MECTTRMCPPLRHVHRLSAETQSHLSWRRVPDPPLPLHPGPLGWSHHLASAVHDLQSRVHRPATLRLALSPDATRGGARCLVGHTRWSRFGAVCGDRAYLAHGPLPGGLCARPSEYHSGADTVWSALTHLSWRRPCLSGATALREKAGL